MFREYSNMLSLLLKYEILRKKIVFKIQSNSEDV